MKKILEILGYVIAVLVVIFLAISVWGLYLPQTDFYFAKIKQEKEDKIFAEKEKEFIEMLKNDTFGGKTPEETFDMFLMALKAEDIEKASKYYVNWDQQKALKNLKKEITEEGNLNKIIVYFTNVREKGKKVCSELKSLGGCTFEYKYITTSDEKVSVKGRDEIIFIPKGSKEIMMTSFELNKFANIWKITQPY